MKESILISWILRRNCKIEDFEEIMEEVKRGNQTKSSPTAVAGDWVYV